MKRRTFIYTTVAAGAGLGIAGYFFLKKESKWIKQPLIYPYILSGICDEETLRKIGVAYRGKVPAENSKEELLRLLRPFTNANQISLNDNSDMVNDLELKVEMDFKENKLITVSGWVLSETEARQCALLSLS